MHLTVLARYGSVFFQHYGCVVVETWSPAFKERGHQHHSAFLGQLAEERGRWTRYRLCQFKAVDVFLQTEVERVVQLLQHHEFCPLLGQVLDALGQPLSIVVAVSGIVLLYDAYFHAFSRNFAAKLLYFFRSPNFFVEKLN